MKFSKEHKEVKAKKRTRTTRYGYMDGVDFDHEVGAASGNVIYASPDELLKDSPCAEGCGIYRVRVVKEKVVLPQNFAHGIYDSESEINKQLLKHAEERKVKLEKSILFVTNRIETLKKDLDLQKKGASRGRTKKTS